MGKIGLPELLVILFIVLLLFGAGKIPSIAKSLAEGMKEFKKAIAGKEEKEDETQKKS